MKLGCQINVFRIFDELPRKEKGMDGKTERKRAEQKGKKEERSKANMRKKKEGRPGRDGKD
jgi:hypothetical protein